MGEKVKYLDMLLSDKKTFFKFMRIKYPLFYNSNIFLRDVQYAIRSYFEKKDIELKYPEAEKLAFEFTAALETEKELINLGNNAWKINFSIDEKTIVKEEIQAV